MTSDDNNFNDFSQNQLTKCRAIKRVLRQMGTVHSFVQSNFFTTVNINGLNTIYSQASTKFCGRAAQCTCTKAQVINLYTVMTVG